MVFLHFFMLLCSLIMLSQILVHRCVIRGCVPKKILVYGASFRGEIEDARNYGWEVNEKLNFNWKKLLHKKMLCREGKIVGPNEVEMTQLDGTKLSYSAKHILIATSSRAHRPRIPGQELDIISDKALSLDDLPKHVVVLGGGYIIIEFASIWRGLGANVDLFFKKELPLRLLFNVGIHPSAAEEFVTMRSVSRRITAGGKPKTNL